MRSWHTTKFLPQFGLVEQTDVGVTEGAVVAKNVFAPQPGPLRTRPGIEGVSYEGGTAIYGYHGNEQLYVADSDPNSLDDIKRGTIVESTPLYSLESRIGQGSEKAPYAITDAAHLQVGTTYYVAYCDIVAAQVVILTYTDGVLTDRTVNRNHSYTRPKVLLRLINSKVYLFAATGTTLYEIDIAAGTDVAANAIYYDDFDIVVSAGTVYYLMLTPAVATNTQVYSIVVGGGLSSTLMTMGAQYKRVALTLAGTSLLYCFASKESSNTLVSARVSTSGTVAHSDVVLNTVYCDSIEVQREGGTVYLHYSAWNADRVWILDESDTTKFTVTSSCKLDNYRQTSKLTFVDGRIYSLSRWSDREITSHAFGNIYQFAECTGGAGYFFWQCQSIANYNVFGMLVEWIKFDKPALEDPVPGETDDLEPDGVTPTPLPVSRYQTYSAGKGSDELLQMTDLSLKGVVCHINPEVKTYNDQSDHSHGVDSVTFGRLPNHQGIQVRTNNVSIYTGGLPLLYDGSSISEYYFEHPPMVWHTAVVNSSDPQPLANGSYLVQATYCWMDRYGKLYESAPSKAMTLTVDENDGYGTTSIIVFSHTATRKQLDGYDEDAVWIRLYMTENNGTIPYLLAEGQNDPRSQYTSFTINSTAIPLPVKHDVMLYTSAGILPNDTLPATRSMAISNNRTWAVSSDDPTNVWICKESLANDAPGSATLTNIAQIPVPASVVASVDYHPILGCSDGVYTIPGNPPNNTGHGSTLGDPVRISVYKADYDPSWAVNIHNGCYMMTDHGIQFIDRSLAMTPIGQRVRTTGSAANKTIVTSVHHAKWSTVQWFFDDTTSLIHCYETDQWFMWAYPFTADTPGLSGEYIFTKSSDMYKLNEDIQSDDSASFSVEYQAGRISNPEDEVRVKSVSFYFETMQAASMTVGMVRDKVTYDTAAINMATDYRDIYNHDRVRRHLEVQRASMFYPYLQYNTKTTYLSYTTLPWIGVEYLASNALRLVKEDSNV